MAEFTNKGPIYTTAAKYEYKRTHNELEIGREYKIVDWEAQEKLVSGESIKTINNQSILGDGNITITDTTYTGDNTTVEISDANVISIKDKGITEAKLSDEVQAKLNKACDAYTITKAETAETGFAATYQLFKGSEAVGDKINIPKDFLVKSAELKVCEETDKPVKGYVVGDKYIDFVVNTTDTSATDSHIYLNVKDLVDTYTGGADINVSETNVISAADTLARRADTISAVSEEVNGHKVTLGGTLQNPTITIEAPAPTVDTNTTYTFSNGKTAEETVLYNVVRVKSSDSETPVDITINNVENSNKTTTITNGAEGDAEVSYTAEELKAALETKSEIKNAEGAVITELQTETVSDILGVVSVVEENNTNIVTSGGVYNAIKDLGKCLPEFPEDKTKSYSLKLIPENGELKLTWVADTTINDI